MNASARIKKIQIFLNLKYNLKGHLRSHNVILKFQNHLFLRNIICLTTNHLKTVQECQHYEHTNLSSVHIRPNLPIAHSFMDRF